MRTARCFAAAALLAVHAACSDAAPSPGGAGGATASSSAATGGGAAVSTSASTGSGFGDCEDGPVVPGSGDVLTIDSVEALVLDTDGAPVANELAQVCGLDLCINGETDSTGHLLMAPGATIVQPAFKFGDATTHAKMARPLSASTTAFGTVITPRLPPLEEGAPFVPGQDASSGGVTLSLPEDGVVDLDISILDDPALQRFRAAAIPKETMDPAIVDQGPMLQMFVAFAPLETHFCPPAKLTATNAAGFPAGAEVEVFVLGLDVGERWATYGSWTRVSDGRVSDDGATITTNDGEGLPVLSAIGVRLK